MEGVWKSMKVVVGAKYKIRRVGHEGEHTVEVKVVENAHILVEFTNGDTKWLDKAVFPTSPWWVTEVL